MSGILGFAEGRFRGNCSPKFVERGPVDVTEARASPTENVLELGSHIFGVLLVGRLVVFAGSD